MQGIKSKEHEQSFNVAYGRTDNIDNSENFSKSNAVQDNVSTTSIHSCIDDVLTLNLSDKGFNFGHLNIQGICGKDMTKFEELKSLISSPVNNNLHLLGLSETKLKEHKHTKAFNIEGFQEPFRKDNLTNGGGGLMVYVKNGINVKRREDLETNEISCIWMEIMQEKSKLFLIGNLYRPPNSKIEFNDRFEEFMDKVSNEEKEIILMGDFNKNLLTNTCDREWLNFTLSLGLNQMVSQPTRVTSSTCTLIDHIYTNREEHISSVSVSKLTLSDHYAVFGNRKLNNPTHKNSHHTISYRSFKHFDVNAFRNELIQVPWETVEYFDDVNEMIQVWNSLFLEVLNKHAPVVQHRVKRLRQPDWISPEILDNIKERNKHKINGKTDEYIYFRNKVSEMIKSAKKEMYKAKLEEGKDDPRSIWKLFRELGAGGKSDSKKNIFGLTINNEFVSSDFDVANEFNQYFASVASQLKEPIQFSNFEQIKSHVDSKVSSSISFSIPEINQSFVRKYLFNLDVTKSTGLDCIGPRVLNTAHDIICSSITHIINKSLQNSIFPTVWKNAKICPIHKSGQKDDVNNYRPISVLPTISKIIEKWVHIKFMTFLNNHRLLHQTQSGFRNGHSTESALLLMTDSWLKAVNDGKLVGCVMVDFRKAFDLVDHDILLQKLALYKCNSNSLLWFKSYLTQRIQQVSIKNTKSDSKDIICGVPQGSILGPLLFLIFINDLPLILQNVVAATDLYADDTTIYDVQSDKQTLENNLQKSLNLLKQWCKENGMLLNTNKTKVMLITSRRKRLNLKDKSLMLKYNDLDLKVVNNDKILGINIDENLIWNSQYQQVVKKVSSHLWLLSQISSYLTIEYRLLFYNAYIRPHFDYCSVIWGNSTCFNINKITKLQRRACKLILRNEYLTLEEARDRLKILSFTESVFLQKAKVMYKVANNIAPEYLTDLFQMRSCNTDDTISNLRSISNRNFLIPKPKIDLFKNSMSYSGALIWNSIPLEIKNATTLSSFVNKCTVWLKH
ncbi:MAG: hypothetical protein JAY74_25915 [Candidatus Thiodiazotropha taylori]|nr:hypothetical protein [Candidatus Thiodiazotropha taylori]